MNFIILLTLLYLCFTQTLQMLQFGDIIRHHSGLKIFLEKWFKKMEGKND